MAEFFGVERQRRGDRNHLVSEIGPGIQQRLGHGAVDHAGIEVTIAVMRGQPLAERALAGGGRSVDRDDHECGRPARLRGPRARRSGRSSVKMLREANSAGLEKVRYSRIPASSNDVVCHARSRYRDGAKAQAGTRGKAYSWERYSATAPMSASWRLPSDNGSSHSISIRLAVSGAV